VLARAPQPDDCCWLPEQPCQLSPKRHRRSLDTPSYTMLDATITTVPHCADGCHARLQQQVLSVEEKFRQPVMAGSVPVSVAGQPALQPRTPKSQLRQHSRIDPYTTPPRSSPAPHRVGSLRRRFSATPPAPPAGPTERTSAASSLQRTASQSVSFGAACGSDSTRQSRSKPAHLFLQDVLAIARQCTNPSVAPAPLPDSSQRVAERRTATQGESLPSPPEPQAFGTMSQPPASPQPCQPVLAPHGQAHNNSRALKVLQPRAAPDRWSPAASTEASAVFARLACAFPLEHTAGYADGEGSCRGSGCGSSSEGADSDTDGARNAAWDRLPFGLLDEDDDAGSEAGASDGDAGDDSGAWGFLPFDLLGEDQTMVSEAGASGAATPSKQAIPAGQLHQGGLAGGYSLAEEESDAAATRCAVPQRAGAEERQSINGQDGVASTSEGGPRAAATGLTQRNVLGEGICEARSLEHSSVEPALSHASQSSELRSSSGRTHTGADDPEQPLSQASSAHPSSAGVRHSFESATSHTRSYASAASRVLSGTASGYYSARSGSVASLASLPAVASPAGRAAGAAVDSHATTPARSGLANAPFQTARSDIAWGASMQRAEEVNANNAEQRAAEGAGAVPGSGTNTERSHEASCRTSGGLPKACPSSQHSLSATIAAAGALAAGEDRAGSSSQQSGMSEEQSRSGSASAAPSAGQLAAGHAMPGSPPSESPSPSRSAPFQCPSGGASPASARPPTALNPFNSPLPALHHSPEPSSRAAGGGRDVSVSHALIAGDALGGLLEASGSWLATPRCRTAAHSEHGRCPGSAATDAGLDCRAIQAASNARAAGMHRRPSGADSFGQISEPATSRSAEVGTGYNGEPSAEHASRGSHPGSTSTPSRDEWVGGDAGSAPLATAASESGSARAGDSKSTPQSAERASDAADEGTQSARRVPGVVDAHVWNPPEARASPVRAPITVEYLQAPMTPGAPAMQPQASASGDAAQTRPGHLRALPEVLAAAQAEREHSNAAPSITVATAASAAALRMPVRSITASDGMPVPEVQLGWLAAVQRVPAPPHSCSEVFSGAQDGKAEAPSARCAMTASGETSAGAEHAVGSVDQASGASARHGSGVQVSVSAQNRAGAVGTAACPTGATQPALPQTEEADEQAVASSTARESKTAPSPTAADNRSVHPAEHEGPCTASGRQQVEQAVLSTALTQAATVPPEQASKAAADASEPPQTGRIEERPEAVPTAERKATAASQGPCDMSLSADREQPIIALANSDAATSHVASAASGVIQQPQQEHGRQAGHAQSASGHSHTPSSNASQTDTANPTNSLDTHTGTTIFSKPADSAMTQSLDHATSYNATSGALSILCVIVSLQAALPRPAQVAATRGLSANASCHTWMLKS
jgi:hypothetical protein